MRIFFLAMLIAVLSGSAVLADPANRTKPDFTTPLERLPPPKRTAGNTCAAFGPGFAKVAGTDTCMKIGGSIRVDVGSGGGVR